MFVSRLIIRNLRGVKHADISLSDGANILVGRNGSGKSTILFALRLLFDSSMSSDNRILDEGDLFGNDGFRGPANVVVAVQLSGYDESSAPDLIQRLDFMVDADTAASSWIVYRFRPSHQTQIKIENKELSFTDLRQIHYEYSRYTGVAADPLSLEWNDTMAGKSVNDAALRSISLTEIPAIRDVVTVLRNSKISPLAKLLDTYSVSEDDRNAVEAEYVRAQKVVEKVPQFSDLASDVRATYQQIAQEVPLSMRLAITPPKYNAIIRSLGMLLSDNVVTDMELRHNGLGINNLIYIAILFRTFEQELEELRGSKVLLLEEPEAHLHPQAQLGLMSSILSRSFQTIVTTHSPYVAMSGSLDRVINLDRDDAVKGINIAAAAEFEPQELRDIERFLRFDRGSVFFASAVILVEGPSEQILVNAYAAAAGIHLSQLGIQICSINGTHFAAYEKLLGPRGIARRFVSIRDKDTKADPFDEPLLDDGSNVSAIVGRYETLTTLECAVTQLEALEGLIEALRSFNVRDCVSELVAARAAQNVTGELQQSVLRAVKDIGKARFAQRFASEIENRTLKPPLYIHGAILEAVRPQGQADERPGVSDVARID